jgi:hypothetical protein
MMRQHAELLERRTGAGVPEWRNRITSKHPKTNPPCSGITQNAWDFSHLLEPFTG